MESLQAFNLEQWIEANRAQLRPPVGNKRVFRDGDFIIMVVGGPNARKDYHVDPGQEFFYQLEGNMVLKTMQDGRALDVPIREGEVLLIPPKMPHSPQRPADTIGLVIERARRPGELDHEPDRSEEHTSELQSRFDLVCRLLLEKKKIQLRLIANGPRTQFLLIE